jgi:dihydrofolate reductase
VPGRADGAGDGGDPVARSLTGAVPAAEFGRQLHRLAGGRGRATHRAPEDVPEGGVYSFVTDGIESALRQAKEVAGGKDVAVMGGAEIGRQFIRAGLVDHIGIHLAPVLFGGGDRLFDHIGDDHIQLEVVNVVDTPQATHLLYRIVK